MANFPFKKAYSPEGVNEKTQEYLDSLSEKDRKYLTGICGYPLTEGVPNFTRRLNDKIIEGENNTLIVLGRDRWSSRCSGYGAHSDSGAIDIVVGLSSVIKEQTIQNSPTGVRTTSDYDETLNAWGDRWVDPNFFWDAARIYISQHTDIDANFKLAPGKMGSSPGVDDALTSPMHRTPSLGNFGETGKIEPRSAIAIKADGVRIIGRQGIKLVTGTDVRLSSGAKLLTNARGIELIAGNDSRDQQSMVKGNNLEQCLKGMVTHINNLTAIVNQLLVHQTSLNEAVTHHYHTLAVTYPGQPTTVSFSTQRAGIKTALDNFGNTKRSVQLQKTNLGQYLGKYLTRGGKYYINSEFNTVN
jgi:hypothetical protein